MRRSLSSLTWRDAPRFRNPNVRGYPVRFLQCPAGCARSRILSAEAHRRAPMATILIVEDHEDTVDIYRTILTVSGHETLTAADGGTGLRLALERLPDLVVLDLGLPVLDGWQVLERLKADDRGRNIPVLVVTAHGDAQSDDGLTHLLCGDVVLKPVAPRELLRRVEGCLAAV